jgi:3'-phosphoadenosine 5'-phosphosulfate sulfotransferase (PAPS reductase)/FAD synthetase
VGSRFSPIHDQLQILPGRDPDAVIGEAKRIHVPIKTFCLISGGHDSMVTAHRCRNHYDELVWIDTGTAVPGVQEFVRGAAEWLHKPLRVLSQPFDAFRLLVLGGVDPVGRRSHVLGFPGPPQHGVAYRRLKGRPLEALLRETKAGHPRWVRVMALTGVRRAESARRSKRLATNREGSWVFVNLLIDWTLGHLRQYRVEHDLPESDVSALLHRSGECNCGSFAEPGERELLRSLWPEWFHQRIRPIEEEAERLRLQCAKWGASRDTPAAMPAGPLCSSCEFRQLSMQERG